MQLITLVFATSAVIASASAQAVFNPTTDAFVCPSTGGNFCTGPSLSNNIIIRCTGTVGQPGNCNDNLAGIPPGGLKNSALCYQSSPTSGSAACSLNNIAYPDYGSPFPIPSSIKTYPTSGTGGVAATATAAPFTVPVAAMATLNNAPFPIVSVANNGTGVGGVVLGSATGTGQVVKPTVAFVGGAARGGVGMVGVVVGAGVLAAAVLL
ncbi:hypothetical protein JMJ35_001529 [Cladonia borealis]|uniref:Uncharacterized protein n=1 Tax=Cladonia borealis TaxID=184061 RepID=A0AA39R818_9LECA|nr:hypothetical protein JMJ35_001529 [Cladonia borealis]